MKLSMSIICPAGFKSPRSADVADLLEAAMRAADEGRTVGVVLVFHQTQAHADAAKCAAAEALEVAFSEGLRRCSTH